MNKEATNKKDFLKFRSEFGKHLQTLRKEKNISQEELAARAGVDRVAIGYIEQGIRSPKLETIYNVSSALGVDVKELFDL